MRRPLTLLLVLAPLLVGCERTDTKPVAGLPPATGAQPPESAAVIVAGSGWNDDDGKYFVVAGEAPHTGVVVYPGLGDTTTLAIPTPPVVDHPTLALLGRAGVIGRARLTGATAVPDTACDAWPSARLAPITPMGDSARWSVAFIDRSVEGLALDSIEHFSRADSGRLVVELARIASGLPNDTVAAFRGLPFNVRAAWRFPTSAATAGVVAEITRRVAQEANQREERLLVVAEQDTTTAGRWNAAYSVRVTGTEETVDALDVLAVVRLGREQRLVIVVSHETVRGTWYEFVVRDVNGRWRRQWRSSPAGC